MIGSLDNKPGWRCEACKQTPSRWFSTSCPRCAKIFLGCGHCASEASLETELGNHTSSCSYSLPNLSGPVQASPWPFDRRALVRHGAKAGALAGKVHGPVHTAAGGFLGAILGGLAGHVLSKPEVQPLMDVVRSLGEPLQDVLTVLRAPQEKK